MTASGSFDVTTGRSASACDGKRLPGPWLVLRPMDAATQMHEHGTGTIVIRRRHHIACPRRVPKRRPTKASVGLICSDANHRERSAVGEPARCSRPNPLATAPTQGDPVLI